jgi:hypothetical protein
VTETESGIRHYYVDEAGDPTLFSAKGAVLIGKEGCSRYFILGLLDVSDPEDLGRDLAALRARLLADPYFSGVPSMQPCARKTALSFHAKDDLPEIRREVFACLLRHPLRFHAVIREKQKVLTYVKQRNEREPSYRYNPNELYDLTVSRLFKDKLHKADEYSITFARRGKADRTAALMSALRLAQRRFFQKYQIDSRAEIRIRAHASAHCAGLQAADYFLWALQRLYERGEERFVGLLWPKFRLIQDVDDTRSAPYGVYYTQKFPLGAEAIKRP